jgi:uncharacterized protein YfbU (UPF0304 family)
MSLATVQKLQKLLSPTNIRHLDRVLAILTDPASRTYSVFYQELGVKHGDVTEPVKGAIYGTLGQLRALVREYGGLL